MENEINRRLNILNSMKAPVISARLRQGGMQERIHRQEVYRYGKDIECQKICLSNKLKSIKPKDDGMMMAQSSDMDILGNFNEPSMKRIRRLGGFF